MTPQTEIDYNLQRERQERISAAVATDPAARLIHLKLAELHADRARQIASLDAPPTCRETPA